MESATTNNRTIFLIGFMGSGKTTWGRKLAQKTGWPFIDLDEQITQLIGQSIPEYFEHYGEDAFRELESRTLKGLAFTQPTVVSTGGGTPCFFDNMAWMNDNGTTVYLQLPPKVLWDRLTKSNITSRPALQGLSGEQLLEHIQAKLAEREPHYRKAAHVMNQLSLTVDDLIKLTDNS
ncbi:shikimate kinase [Parapedobacter lycopersici]|uniref:shikimate kinase n=1 Tax=Parapedobacter lycopersici TaxID=1864939 RepID=UPI00214DA1A6|nr:shikimate kinase [Parapedobacter lycopersici]